jgi:hypothetical protein
MHAYAIWDNLIRREHSGGGKILKWILNEYGLWECTGLI